MIGAVGGMAMSSTSLEWLEVMERLDDDHAVVINSHVPVLTKFSGFRDNL
jgi:hypothetical protein